MGMFDKLRDFFKGSEADSVVEKDDTYEKSMLAAKIIDVVNAIKRINSFDSSIWNLNNVSSSELKSRSLADLEQLYSRLSGRLSEISKQEQRGDKRREDLEASKWTGQKPKHLTDYEFDRFQRDEGR